MRIVLCAICFVLSFAVAGGQAQQQPEPQPPEQAQDQIAGFYESQGIGVSGEPYRGLVEVVKRGDGIYSLQWLSGSLGVGIVQGDVLAVSFFGVGPDEISIGVALYKIKPGQLVGEWANYGYSTVYPEILTKTTEAPQSQPEKPKPSQRQPIVAGSSRIV